MMKMKKTKTLVLSGLFLAIGMLLPLLTGQIKEIGDSLLPMHIPVLLCGAICGWPYGAIVGLSLPFLRSATFGMPPIYPNAVWMALELAAYGLVMGLLYGLGKKHRRGYVYFCLVIAMLAGRVVWGVSKAILMGVAGKSFGMAAFLAGGFADAVPGIILQLVAVPAILALVERMNRKGGAA